MAPAGDQICDQRTILAADRKLIPKGDIDVEKYDGFRPRRCGDPDWHADM
jgi:hypothetical protein